MNKTVLRQLLSAGFILIAILTLLASTCFARSLDIQQVEIEAEIMPDGSMRVIETRTVDFSGAFSGLEQALHYHGNIYYTDILVREGEEHYLRVDRFPTSDPGTFALQQEGETLLVDWSYRAYNQKKAFTLEYTVHDVVVVHEDVAELGYFFIGDSWEFPTGRVFVELTLPEGAEKEDLRTWGHGARHGQVKIVGPRLVTWEISPLPAGESLGGRVTFPPELVPRAARFSGIEALPGILREEEGHARRANLARTARALEPLYAILALMLAGLALALLWKQSANRGKAFRGDYYRELPGDYPPEVAGYLLSKKKMRDSFFSAGILNLARRGFLRIEKLQTATGRGATAADDYRLIKVERDEPLNSLDRRLYSFLFETLPSPSPVEEGGNPGSIEAPVSVTFSEIREYAKKEPAEFRKFYRGWKDAIERIGDARNFFESYHYRPLQIFAVILFGLIAFAAYSYQFSSLFFAALISAAALFILGPKHWFTDYGADQKAKWEAFENYLRNFSNIRDSSVSSLALWEHFLVYAVAFGFAERVISQLALAMPGPAGAHAPGSGLFGMATLEATGDTSYFDSFSIMNRSLANTTGHVHNRVALGDAWNVTKSVWSGSGDSSSGSGSGGGFSGGGGGSFGGGGGSFR